MKTSIISLIAAGAAALAATGMQSCVSDEPFADGNGVLRMRMVIDSEVSRAETDATDLGATALICISNDKGIVKRFNGISDIPDNIRLKSGAYTAEAWAGKKSYASFTDKYYKGSQTFSITPGTNSITLDCRIANIVASVNGATVDPAMMTDYTVTIGHAKGSLDFTADNIDSRGYYLMPEGVTDLSYTITGVNGDGNRFEKTGIIPDVKPTHEYRLNLSYNPSYEDMGGAFITVTIDETELLIESEVQILGRPDFAGIDFDIDKQVYAEPGAFTDKIIRVRAFGGYKTLSVTTPDYEAYGLPARVIDFTTLDNSVQSTQEVRDAGLDWSMTKPADRQYHLAYITFKAELLNRLPDGQHEFDIRALDNYGKHTDIKLRIAVGAGAVVIEDPVTTVAIDQSDQMAVLTSRATLRGRLNDPDAVNPGIRYREAGTTEWSFAPAGRLAAQRRRLAAQHIATRAGEAYSVTITGLKASTRYEYQAVADGFEPKESMYFTTEGRFAIPNASMEEWSAYSENSKVLLPAAGGIRSFWDSGNHGAATLSKTLTQGVGSPVHSGTKAAELKSQFVGFGTLGKLAAGNLFVGEYVRTDGTDGVLKFGRQYDSSHPAKLAVWANYRPKTAVDKKGADASYIPAGQTDKGQIYVALTTAPIDIATKNAAKLFDKNDPEVLAYGEVIWDGDFGPDGQLQRVEIPITYYDKARGTKPLYVVLVCTASLYGDYFSGGDGSTMYLDDFEFVYD